MFNSESEGYLAKITAPAKPARVLSPNDEIATLVPSKSDLAALRAQVCLLLLVSAHCRLLCCCSLALRPRSQMTVSSPPRLLLLQELSGDKASPSARHLLLSHTPAIDIATLRGSGKGGRITKGDVLVALGQAPSQPAVAPSHGARVHLAVAAPAPAAPAAAVAAPVTIAAPAPTLQAAAPASAPSSAASATSAASALPAQSPRPGGGDHKDSKPSMVRKVIASRLTESKATVPHFYVAMDCRIDNLLTLRKTLKVWAPPVPVVSRCNWSGVVVAQHKTPSHCISMISAVLCLEISALPLVFVWAL